MHARSSTPNIRASSTSTNWNSLLSLSKWLWRSPVMRPTISIHFIRESAPTGCRRYLYYKYSPTTLQISSKSTKGQTLVRIWAALPQRSNIGISIVHIPGNTNNTADLLSRPEKLSTHQLYYYHNYLSLFHKNQDLPTGTFSCQVQCLYRSWHLLSPPPPHQ
jgi:hypothetical protein